MGYIATTAAANPTRRNWRNNFSGLGRLRGRGLGVLSVPVGTSMVYSTSPVARAAVIPVRAVGPARPVMVSDSPAWNINPPRATPYSPAPPGMSWGGGSSYSGYTSPNNPTNPNNLAQLTLQYQSNPASLTAAQWQQLQAAGAIPATVPYANASLVNPLSASNYAGSSSGIDPATGVAYSTELAAAQTGVASTSTILGTDPVTGSTTILGIDWYWLAAAAVGLYFFTGKRR